jgi:hypothetical protein
MLFRELNEDNFILYAAKHYYRPRCIDAEEFYEDIKRFKYTKRLLNRYIQSGELSERLILNHLTIIYNVFGTEPALKMIEYKLGVENLPIIKPFLVYLKMITPDMYTGISMDQKVVNALREI